MKLNPNCIRDILLTIENNNFGEYMTLIELNNKLSNYTQDELHYCCLKLKEADFLELSTLRIVGYNVEQIKTINDLTFKGHEFLENIKNDNNWNKTKDIAKTVGSFSINTLKDISVSVISNLISAQFQ